MKRSVDIIGSCVVRDCFNSKFIQEYGDYFIIKTYLPRIAIPAVMTPCVDYDDGVLADEKTSWYYECYYKSYGKNYLSTIVNNQSNYLLMDFYSDAYLGIREYGNSYITYMGNQNWTKSIDRSKLGRRLNYCTNASEAVFNLQAHHIFSQIREILLRHCLHLFLCQTVLPGSV